ncbi:uncharacterized protein LAJ45_09248 [Morchella importuna]|uniref:uncharacterized protein n=1 Tax=Morchella importuna TaxID=1174673 RepID=UPI001E8DF171|nr:uncharacterized protein LAJ45_09248 [Morchella importuna]KAH8146874.1 hypothetical protein LAJ45_09248 [Morchella importuna]
MAGNNAPPETTGYTGFFYGTLMAVPILFRVVYGTTSPEAWQVASLRVRPAILHSYCRYKVRFVDYPAIIPENGKEVQGTYVEGLTEGDIFRLDRFEGGDYSRKRVQVNVLESNGEEGENVETETYVWTVGEERLEMEEWDFCKFVETKLARWADSTVEYTEVDEADSLRAQSQKRAANAGTLERDQLKESEKEVNAEEIRSAV